MFRAELYFVNQYLYYYLHYFLSPSDKIYFNGA